MNLSYLVRQRWWMVPLLVGMVITLGAVVFFSLGPRPEKAAAAAAGDAEEEDDTQVAQAVRVETIHPTKGGIERTTVQPGTLQAFESAALYAEVSGYLKTQSVDIGARVQKGQVLATIDVPELDKAVEKNRAALAQAEANVKLMQAQAERYQAEQKTAETNIAQAETGVEAARATRVYRHKAYLRIKQLYDSSAVEERLLDEKIEQRDAAVAAEHAAIAAVATARAQAAAAVVRVKQADAEIVNAQAQAGIAKAELERSLVQVGFATITSPYTGIVTKRNFFPGDFVRAANGNERVPLLIVERSDKMRMVVQVPDRDVPYTDPGDPCDVEIDALPGSSWKGTSDYPIAVSRIQGSEDLETRTMRVEIDLPNPTGRLRQGMYGRVMIHLEKPQMTVLSVPSRCLVGKVENGRGAVYVIQDNAAHRVEVRVGADDGVQVEVLSGLKCADEVIRRHSGALSDGSPVARSLPAPVRPAAH